MRTQTFIDYIQAAKRYEDELVGIEMENEGDEGTDKDPYFPDDVRISQHMYSVYQICHWIDEEVLELIRSAHEKAIAILKENMEKLHELAHYLLERETITGEEFMEILKK